MWLKVFLLRLSVLTLSNTAIFFSAVVVDRSNNAQAPTGKFEMVYEIPILKCMYNNMPITVEGTQASIIYVNSSVPKKSSNSSTSSSQMKNSPAPAKLPFSPTIDKITAPLKAMRTSKRSLIKVITPCKIPPSKNIQFPTNQPTTKESTTMAIPTPRTTTQSTTKPLNLTPRITSQSTAKLSVLPTSIPTPKRTINTMPTARSSTSQKTAKPSDPATSIPSSSSSIKTKRTINTIPSQKTVPIQSASQSPQPKTAIRPLTSPIPRNLKPVPQSRQFFEELATRIGQRPTSAHQKSRLRLITPKSASNDIKGLGEEVNRLMDLNETIERLLRFRNPTMKIRAGVVNEFLNSHQKKVW